VCVLVYTHGAQPSPETHVYLKYMLKYLCTIHTSSRYGLTAYLPGKSCELSLSPGGSAHEDCTRGVCDVTKPSGAFGGIFRLS
jgi:hypothetical protein